MGVRRALPHDYIEGISSLPRPYIEVNFTPNPIRDDRRWRSSGDDWASESTRSKRSGSGIKPRLRLLLPVYLPSVPRCW